MSRYLLTPREREVLLRISFGWSLEEIGADLGIAPSTARTHRQHLLTGLEARNVAHAVGIALRTGLLLSGASPIRRHRDAPTEAVRIERERLDRVAS